MLNFLRAEHLQTNTGLVRILKKGTRVVRKKDLKKRYPYSKDNLADFVKKHPSILDLYKSIKGAQGALSNAELDKNLRTEGFCDILAAQLAKIKPGPQAAGEYHKLMAGILTFVFSPDLISPKMEQPLHGGRKRIDISYTNWATEGFFSSIKSAQQTKARYVTIECKNYSEDLKNPEFDQLTGRFGHSRGHFGIICCRRNTNKNAVLARSKDAASDGRGIVIVLDDEDILRLLTLIKSGNNRGISVYLEQRYQEIVF